jgi:acetyltransferase EpsM
MKKLCLIGQGGHSKVIKEIVLSSNEYQIAAWLDDKFTCREEKNGIIYGPVSLAKELAADDENIRFLVAIGQNQIRKKITVELSLPLERYAVLTHPTAVISPSAKIGSGTVIMPYCVVNASAAVGNHAILNTGTVIEHDTILSDYVHVSPKAVLTGGVVIGEGTQIGAGASVIPGIQIGSWSTVGAGATVIRHVNDLVTVAGTPARTINKVRV